MVLDFAILTVGTFLHVHDGLDVARLHLHHDGHAHITVNEFQLVDDGTLGKILNTHVDGRDDVGTVHRRRVHDVKPLVEHLAAVNDSILSAQDAVVAQLKSEAGRVFAAEHGADGTACGRAERTLAGVELLNKETTFERRPHDKLTVVGLRIERHVEDRQSSHLREGVEVHAIVPDGPVARAHLAVLLHLTATFLQMFAESFRRLLGEYLAQAEADGVEFGLPQRVAPRLSERLEVHVEFKFRQRRGHELTVAREDVASVGLHAHAVLLLPGGHLHPVIALGRHYI